MATPLPISIYTLKDQENRSENTSSHQARAASGSGLWACCQACGFVAILPKHRSFIRYSLGTCCVPSPRASVGDISR